MNASSKDAQHIRCSPASAKPDWAKWQNHRHPTTTPKRRGPGQGAQRRLGFDGLYFVGGSCAEETVNGASEDMGSPRTDSS